MKLFVDSSVDAETPERRHCTMIHLLIVDTLQKYDIFVDLIIIPKSCLVDFGIMIESFELLFERYGSGSPSDLLTTNVFVVNKSSGFSFLYILCIYSVKIITLFIFGYEY